MGPVVGRLSKQAGEGFGHGNGRVSELKEKFVLVLDEVIDGEPDEAGDGLGVEEHEAGSS
ncbi:hypothetical protein [Nonomuraea sp. NPDC003201]